METNYQELWRFCTKNLTVLLEVAPEDDEPDGYFSCPEDAAAVRNGEVEWFMARVRILNRLGETLGSDYLGACSYRTFKEFYTSHRDADPMNRNCTIMRDARGANMVICHYFPSMVAQAIAEARVAKASRKRIKRRRK